MVKDPSCGMNVDSKSARKKNLFIEKNKTSFYFCSQDCLDKFSNKGRGNIIEILLSVLLVGVAVLVWYLGYMLQFMGIVFLILASLKLIDTKGFATLFKQYDLIAKNVKVYALVYPFIELILAILFLFQFQIIAAAWITIIIMGIGAIGVGKNIFSKNKVRCACLGSKIKVPLTRFTLVEDLIMFIMGIMILLGF